MEIKSITTIAEGTFYIKVFYKSEIDDIMEWKRRGERIYMSVKDRQMRQPHTAGSTAKAGPYGAEQAP